MPHTDEPSGRAAELRLRGREGTIPVQVRWPDVAVDGAPYPLIVVLTDPSQTEATERADNALSMHLQDDLGALVLQALWAKRGERLTEQAVQRATDVLEWCADHAREIEGDSRQLLIAGRDQAASVAMSIAIRARDRGWPHLRRQVLLVSRPGRKRTARSASTRLGAPAAATIVAPLRGTEYSHRLRAEGGSVTELVDTRVDPISYPGQPFLPSLTDSLQRSLASS